MKKFTSVSVPVFTGSTKFKKSNAMKKLFTVLFLFIMLLTLKAQDKKAPVEILYPDNAFKYDQVLPSMQMSNQHYASENNLIEVMFAEDAKVRLRNGKLLDLKTNATLGLHDLLGQFKWIEWQRFSDVPEEFLDELSETGTQNTGQAVYNLNNIYRLHIPEQQNIWEISNPLENLPGIIYARPVPKPAELPVPPSYQDDQGYLDPAVDIPSGVDNEYAWTQYGGTGAGITICDLEYSWNYNHADITKAVGSQINSNVADPFNDTNHGTAVLGVLVSDNNGWGTTGATYNSALRTCGTYYGYPSPSYNPAGAITLSIANLVAGDIILIEQQFDYTGSNGFVPIEWYGNYSPNGQTNNPVYAAIVNAVANGIHVVEAGGNGNVNTQNISWYGNSGAVIVGAGGGYPTTNLKKLNFSTYGPRFDVQGWGENITTTGYGGLYSQEGTNYLYTSNFGGTSGASPIVTSAIACFSSYWKQNYSSTPPSPANMRSILKRHARLQVNPGDGHIGPRPDLKAMIDGFRYCAASGGCDEYISRVQMGDIDNSSDCNSYADYTTIYSTELPANLSQALTVTNGNTNYPVDECGVWVDWNQDNDFDDPGEQISVNGTPGTGPYTATITPQYGTSIGNYRMRIRITYNQTPAPCGDDIWGEVEDYTIHVVPKVPNEWTGASNSYWYNADNWSLGHKPTPDEDVIIHNVGYQPPIISSVNEECNNLTINTGAWVYIMETSLTTNGNMAIFGQLSMVDNNGGIVCHGDVDWNNNSTADFTASCLFQVYGHWFFNTGANAQLDNGSVSFIGNNVSEVKSKSAVCSFNNVYINKNYSSVVINSDASQPLIINGHINIQSNSGLSNDAVQDIICRGNFYNSGYYYLSDVGKLSTFIFDGTDQYIYMFSANGYFNHLKISPDNSVVLGGGIHTAGDLIIESGLLDTQGNNIIVEGDWDNNVGPDAFVEGTGRVVFDGTGIQYCSNEVFNELEINNPPGAIYVDGTNVVCAAYDWTAGAIDVFNGGTFTANDLIDNGIYGKYILSGASSIINLSNYDGYVDLDCELYINDGTMNVYGGTTPSYWPWDTDAIITMSGGVLDFHDQGIYVFNSSTYTLTENITGGTIRTSQGFIGERGDFTPTGGVFGFYGSGDYYISQSNGCTLYDVDIDKSSKSGPSVSKGVPIVDERSKKVLSDGGKSNAIYLNSDFVITNNLTVSSGSLTLGGHELTVMSSSYFYGTLNMTNASDIFNSGISFYDQFYFYNGSTGNISAGNIYLAWGIVVYNGASFTATIANTINYTSSVYRGGISNDDPNTVFGNINVNKPSGYFEIWSDGSKPIVVDGDFSLAANQFDMQDLTMIVHGTFSDQSASETYLYNALYKSKDGNDGSGGKANSIANNTKEVDAKGAKGGSLEIDSDFTLNGLLDVGDGDVLVHGIFGTAPTGSIIINGGTFTADAPNHAKGWEYLNGNLTMPDGLFEITNNSIFFSPTATTSISGGAMRTGGAFAAIDAGVFQPTGGVVEITYSPYASAIHCSHGNYFYNLAINGNPALTNYFMTEVFIQNDLFINSGILSSFNNDNINIGGDWTNNVGPAGFDEGTGTVVFNGNGAQDCSTEDFYKLVLDKPAGNLEISNGHAVTCQSYQWIDGGIHVDDGAFTAYELDNNNGIFGNYSLSNSNAVVNLHQDVISWINLNANITITAGEMNIYGGTQYSYWPYSNDVNLTMSGGVLDFHTDWGICIDGAATPTLTTNITGGTIRTSGSFFGTSNDFTPTGGVVELYGETNVIAGINGASYFNDLLINKTISHIVNSSANFTVNSSLTIDEGTLSINNKTITVSNEVDVNDGGTLNIDEGAELLLSENSALNINNGGLLEVLGIAGNNATVSHSTGYYEFNVNPGGTITANHATFEYMGNTNGINIKTGAIIDPVNCFNNCTFKNGNPAPSGQTLLTIDNNQALDIMNASFPTTGTTYNVAKNNNNGSVNFTDFTGSFAGEAYDNDPYNRIEWFEAALSVNPTVIDVAPPAGTETFDISANVDWTIAESISWLSLSASSGNGDQSITITYDENTSSTSRSGVITVSGVGVSDVTVTVNQEGTELTVAPANRDVLEAAGTTTFDVTSNTSWAIAENVAWFSVAPMNGSGDETLTVTYLENTSVTPRVGSITVAAPGVPSVVVTVNQEGIGQFNLDLTVFLEGPFNGIDMDTDLNSILPLSQPYNTSPWNYAGSESVSAIPNANVVDWVLVELRDAGSAPGAIPSTMLARQAAFILGDGSVVAMDGSSTLQFSSSINNNLYVVIWHRNHLGIMSASSVPGSGGVYTYNFSTSVNKAYQSGQKAINGKAAMFGGDADGNGDITTTDRTQWSSMAGTTGYSTPDFNMDSQFDNKDKDDVWSGNLGEQDKIPD